jgi:thymidylate kinase
MIQKKNFLIVSFMGVDGSGKTTISKKINKIFGQSKYLHLKPYIIFQDRRTVIKNPHEQTNSTITISFFRLLSWLISYKFFFLINKKHKIYIFDRYAHDILIDPLRYKHNLSKNLTKLILTFFPKPDLWIFLKPSQKTINSRKHELSDTELRRQIKEYSIFFKNKKNVLKLNTNNQRNVSIKLIKKKINCFIK